MICRGLKLTQTEIICLYVNISSLETLTCRFSQKVSQKTMLVILIRMVNIRRISGFSYLLRASQVRPYNKKHSQGDQVKCIRRLSLKKYAYIMDKFKLIYIISNTCVIFSRLALGLSGASVKRTGCSSGTTRSSL